MTLNEYVNWLENRIAIVGKELELLVNARKAMEMASNELDRVTPPLRSPEARRLTLKQTVAKKCIEKAGQNWQASLADVLQLIKGNANLSSGQIITKYYIERDYETLSKREKDRVYAVLSYLKQRNLIVRSPQGAWSVSAAVKENGQ